MFMAIFCFAAVDDVEGPVKPIVIENLQGKSYSSAVVSHGRKKYV